MGDASSVGGGERFGDLNADLDGFSRSSRPELSRRRVTHHNISL